MVFIPELIFIKTCITNIILIDGLRGSSIGNRGNQDNFKSVYYFSRYKNTHNQKQTKKTKISKQKTTKVAVFCAQRLLRGRNRFCWVRYFLCAWNPFVKKIKKFKIVLIASITYTTVLCLISSQERANKHKLY